MELLEALAWARALSFLTVNNLNIQWLGLDVCLLVPVFMPHISSFLHLLFLNALSLIGSI